MDIPRIRRRLAELATILFEKGLTPNWIPEEEEKQTISLWAVVIDLDHHYQDLEHVSKEFPRETFRGISLNEDNICQLVEKTSGLRKCTHGSGCDHCALQVRLVIVKLQLYTKQLVISLRETVLQDANLQHEYSDNPLLSIAPRLYMSLSSRNSTNDVDAVVNLSNEVIRITEKIAEGKVQNFAPEENQAFENTKFEKTTHSPKLDMTSEVSKLEACESCKTPVGIIEDLASCRLQLAKASAETAELKNELVERFRAEQKWDKAAEIYLQLTSFAKAQMKSHKLILADEEFIRWEEEYLDNRYELAEMYRKLEKNEEGLEIAKDTHERRAKLNKFSANEKKSHYQYCVFLRSLKRYDDVKVEYRRIWLEAKEIDPARAIENGYQLGCTLEETRGPSVALDKYWEVFDEGSKRLGLERKLMVEVAEKLIAAAEKEGEPLVSKRSIDDVLKAVWNARAEASFVSTNLLAIGFKYGTRLLKSKDYESAASVLETVWTTRNSQQGAKDLGTLEAADHLYDSYIGYKNYEGAVKVGKWIVEVRRKKSKTSLETINSEHSLGKQLERTNSLKDSAVNVKGARSYLKDSWDARKKLQGVDHLQTLENGFDYGKVLSQLNEVAKAESVFTEVWKFSHEVLLKKQLSKKEEDTLLSYGLRLTQCLEHQHEQRDKAKLAAQVWEQLVFLEKTKPPSAETNSHLLKYGKCLFHNQRYEDALKVLRQVWDGSNIVGPRDSDDALDSGYYSCLCWLEMSKEHNHSRDDRKGYFGNAAKIMNEVIDLATKKNVVGQTPEKYIDAWDAVKHHHWNKREKGTGRRKR
ncbi:hypothetical protein GLAREA_02440 [Glarea lozoyensis ATCC 20868]|uniref:TPR-like protein n=1 Tax=Glarea lozoyensis (strain ATCC 20868 / MF5171) TaxID=1116229 RepID=S3CJ35_GLAL2|nr:uncharacterized protein GLAREA_02440 [Glarea lozoyensis ATCC 20868]EPE26527.1 hypothetical protein GLAREA_02440 [Glarea lozoyensis ATCC 20868]